MSRPALQPAPEDPRVPAGPRRRSRPASELAEARSHTAAARQELETLAYAVSHDLGAPLRAVNGFSLILEEEYGAALPPEAGRYLAMVRENAGRLTAMIEAILSYSRLGRQELVERDVDHAALAREALDDLATPREGHRVDLRIGTLPPGRGDPTLIRRLWLNLLDNALKFTRTREEAVIEAGCDDRNGVRVYHVKDNGVGFDPAAAPRLFGLFQRFHRETEYEGLGTGLAMVQRIVQRHGGTLWAEAEPDRGASFFFTLHPVGRPPVAGGEGPR